MDSITQALLGGAVGMAVAGRRHPRRAWLYGAAFGTLPDLDVVVRYASAVDNFTLHRGLTHSWLVHGVAAPLLGLAMSRLDGHFSLHRWMALIALVLITHAGLDALTVYGTQLLWPLPVAPVSGGSVFIIDPLYTLPLLVLAILVWVQPTQRVIKAGAVVLTLTTAYLGWGLVAQSMVTQRVSGELARLGIHAERVDVTAAPFTTFLWRIVVMTPEHYLQGFASVFDDSPRIRFFAFDRGRTHEELLVDNTDFARLNWFSHGFIALRKVDDLLLATDLRMGAEPAYVFRFVLLQRDGEAWNRVTPYLLDRPDLPEGFLALLVRRIIDAATDPGLVGSATALEQDHGPYECGEEQTDQHRC